MNQLEKNLRISFEQVRNEIFEIKNQVLSLAQRQNELAELIDKSKKQTKTVTNVKTVGPKTIKKTYVASKEGKKFHIQECPYAQNIKPKSKVNFETKDSALNKGYKPCNCVK